MTRHKFGELYDKNMIKERLADDEFVYRDRAFYDQLSRDEIIADTLLLVRKYNKIIESNTTLKLSNNHLIRIINKNNKVIK